MIRSAYQQVNNLIVQFTTARGAAQRVFEMLDALPDVDLNAGIKLRREDVHGTFELSNVQFAYQMRPKEKGRLERCSEIELLKSLSRSHSMSSKLT